MEHGSVLHHVCVPSLPDSSILASPCHLLQLEHWSYTGSTSQRSTRVFLKAGPPRQILTGALLNKLRRKLSFVHLGLYMGHLGPVRNPWLPELAGSAAAAICSAPGLGGGASHCSVVRHTDSSKVTLTGLQKKLHSPHISGGCLT